MIDWKPKFLTVDRVVIGDDNSPELDPVLAVEGFPKGGEEFVDLLDHQMRAVLKHKPDTGVSSPCKVYGFTDGEVGQSDRKVLEELLQAGALENFQVWADQVGESVVALPDVKPGVLVQILVDATFDEKEFPIYFALLMSYLPTDRLLFGDEVTLEEVADVVPRDPSLALAYPYGDYPDDVSPDLVKILCRPASHSWSSLFSVASPPTTEKLLQDEVGKAYRKLDKDKWKLVKKLFARVPPKRRPLFSEERIIPQEALLGPAAAGGVARESQRTAKDLYGKDQVLKVKMGNATITLPANELNETFAFARKGDHEYLVIKAKATMSQKGCITAAELTDIDSLEEACERISE